MPKLDQSDQELIQSLVALGQSTSATILSYYGNKSALNTQNKANDTPITDADLAAHDQLTQYLPQIINIPVVSEESTLHEHYLAHEDYWLVDPIDGTSNFIDETDEFCIAIARIKASRPVIGFIFAPTTNQYWVALYQQGAFKGIARDATLDLKHIHSSRKQLSDYQNDDHDINEIISDRLRVITSHSGKSSLLKQFISQTSPVHERLYAGSALKFCRIAEGQADVYPKLSSTTSQWDIAAGELIVNEASGGILMLGREVIEYGPKQPMLNPPFIAYGADVSAAQLAIYRQFMQDNLSS